MSIRHILLMLVSFYAKVVGPIKKMLEILREMREDKDLTQKELARLLGTSQQYYSKYETGKFDIPVRVLVQLAELYGVSVDYLLDRTECAAGMDALGAPVTPVCSAGRLLSDVLALDPKRRADVVEFVEFQLQKQHI